jgi:hypothetical protein
MVRSSGISNTVSLPRWASDIVGNPPKSGEGFHRWLFRAGRALWQCGRSESDIIAILDNAATACGRHVSAREIQDSAKNSRTRSFQGSGAQRRPWPSLNCEQREAITTSGGGLVDLWETSPVRFEDNVVHTEQIIDATFPGNPLLCCAATKATARTAKREEWRGRMSQLQLIVPNPMTFVTGLNQSGEVSNRCLSNTGARRFLIVEFDAGTLDQHAALLLHLAERAPLALTVFSGSKSLHGWFYCAGIPDEKLSRFFRYAVSLGADVATWTSCQLVRMPDGVRDNNRRQTVYFLNPEVIQW